MKAVLVVLLALCVASSFAFKLAHNGAHQVESLVEVSSQVNSEVAAPASSTVIDQTNKLYWNSPGDGTVSMSWLLMGIVFAGLCILSVSITAVTYICCCQAKTVAPIDV